MADGSYSIKRIRLINFHNFIDESIELENGGHLFLLGDNGCGKTTILDAVHYVLTAGKKMEWNSAARLSGPRRDGRRVQGIVLRHNIDTGILNTGGAITYVALEIKGRHGKPLCIGMGISATALDERIGFWGFIRECALESLPFTVTGNDNIRPASRQEFKQQLNSGHGFYTSQAAYRKDLGNRLFGGEESYLEICRFLAMGKSYREISAGAADYHQLFKSLLPEPRSSVFEQIIEALRTLDGSQALLDDLQRKLDWLNNLNFKVEAITRSSQSELRYLWLLHHFIIQLQQKEGERCKTELQNKTIQIGADETKLEELEQENTSLEERLNVLLTKDSSGLVGREKRCRADLEQKERNLSEEQKEGKRLETDLKKHEKERKRQEENLTVMIKKLLPVIARRGAALPFGITGFQAELDRLGRTENFSTSTPPLAKQIVSLCEKHRLELTRESTLLQQQITTLEETIDQLHNEIEQLEKRKDIQPRLNGYEQFEQLLINSMLTPRPIFRGLEWSQTLKQQEKNSIEESLGEELLGTQLIRYGDDYQKARNLCTEFPGLRISAIKEEYLELPEWVRQVFDIKESEPDCLRALASEMESSGLQPSVSMVKNKPVFRFRNHERTLTGVSARLIGGENRKKALAAEINSLQKKMQQAERAIKSLQKNYSSIISKERNLADFKEFIDQQCENIRDNLSLLHDTIRTVDSSRELLKKQQSVERKIVKEVELLNDQAAELSEQINREGLATLEKRIGKVKRNRKIITDRISNLNRDIGGNKLQVTQLEEAKATALNICQSHIDKQKAVEEKLVRTLPTGTEPAHFVLRTKKGQQFRSQTAIEKEINDCITERQVTVERLKEQLNSPEFGGAFRFTYDEELNRLFDYRQQELAAIIEQQSRDLLEQQQVINDRTRELFKKIIMTDLMQYLRGHVGEMESMKNRINTLLNNRTFGNQQYSFKLTPLDGFKRLITIIKKISPFNPAGEKELEQFFQDHREAIIATETGSIPEELDYRNWYRYEMVVSTVGEEGKVIDRRNKSLGSGGEQAVPNYLLILTIAHFMYRGKKTRLHTLLFDEAFYGIDSGRRDQILGFASDLDLQLFIASPDQDGVRQEVRNSTTLLVKKDVNYDVHLFPFHWKNPANRQTSLFEKSESEREIVFGDEL